MSRKRKWFFAVSKSVQQTESRTSFVFGWMIDSQIKNLHFWVVTFCFISREHCPPSSSHSPYQFHSKSGKLVHSRNDLLFEEEKNSQRYQKCWLRRKVRLRNSRQEDTRNTTKISFRFKIPFLRSWLEEAERDSNTSANDSHGDPILHSFNNFTLQDSSGMKEKHHKEPLDRDLCRSFPSSSFSSLFCSCHFRVISKESHTWIWWQEIVVHWISFCGVCTSIDNKSCYIRNLCRSKRRESTPGILDVFTKIILRSLFTHLFYWSINSDSFCVT